jgi:NAD(P)-dependent dehydrogenase (short-subunit alcohol dehydrogenase family)
MKVALVTGATRGLGQGLAQLLSDAGYCVFAGSRDDKPAGAHQNVTYLKLDVRDDESIKTAIAAIKHQQGRLDLLINNAGIVAVPPRQRDVVSNLPVINRHDMLILMDVNAVSPLMVIKYAVPIMTSDDCFIVNISSDRSSYRTPDTKGNYGYSASKIALNMITHCLLQDLPTNISTFAVHPGWVKTDMNPRGVIEPAEAAQKIVRIIKHWKRELNGQFLDNDGTPFEK